ncbi:unnamed protein product [Discula destructiva]
MNRDPLNQAASSGAPNPNADQMLQRPSQSQSHSQLSSSPSYQAPSTSRLSNRSSPTAIATTHFPPSTFAPAIPTTVAPTPAPATTAPMTASTSNPFQISRFATMTSFHPASLPQFSDATPAPAGASLEARAVITTLFVRGLDASVHQSDLDYMFMAFNHRLLAYELLDTFEGTAAKPTRTARVLTNPATALELKGMLHNKNGMTVDIAERTMQSSGPSSDGASPTTSPAVPVSQAPRFDGFSPVAPAPTSNGNSLLNGNGHVFNNHKSPFSPQSPIGNHLSNQPRVSGKSLINDANDDEDITRDIFRLPREFQAENGSYMTSRADHYPATNGSGPYAANGMASTQRRATAPQLPIAAQMAQLSLNTGTNGIAAAQHGNLGAYPPSAYASTMSPTNMTSSMGYSHHSGYLPHSKERIPPASNPADQNPPCNTLYVGNLPMDAQEEELRRIFASIRGYKRMCYRTKPNGPMCFVEFEDTSTASRAMSELYGFPLSNSKRGGMRLSFSKNPLGVRAQPGGPGSAGSIGGHHGMMGHATNGFSAAAGPPPGLHPYPPGLNPNRSFSSFAAPPGMANGTGTNGSGMGGTTNGAASMTNGTSYASQGTVGNGNNALAIGLGNGANFDQRSEPRGNPWPSSYNTTTKTPNPYASPFTSPYTSPPVGGTNGFGPYGRSGRQASS